MMRWLLLCAALQAGQAQVDLPPDLLLISRIKIAMAQNLSQLPNYTCQQTIERSRRRMPERKFELVDTVHLEVALVEGKELYGWPGADQIAESEISNLVSGTIGNGDFGLLARSIFLSDGALFTRAGEVELGDRHAIRYDYRVSLLSSGYRLRVRPNEAVVGHHGSFWVESGTLDLLRLELTADDIPLSLGLQASTKSLEYRRMEIGGSTFLLPLKAELLMVDLHGTENRNRTQFHGCRQYSGESVLTFDDPPPDTPRPAKVEIAEVNLPDDFTVEIELTTLIDSNSAAIGDTVEAKLSRPLKDHGRLLAPKGAKLKGRIIRLEKRSKSYAFGFTFHSIEFAESRAILTGRDNELSMTATLQKPCLMSAYKACGMEQRTFEPLEIEAHRLRLPPGFRMSLHSRLVKSEKQ